MLARDSGLFLLSLAALLVILLVSLGRQQHWGQRSFLVHLRTPRADGLQPGMLVKISGLPVGRVSDLQLQADASVAIDLEIQSRYRHLIGPRSIAFQGQEGLVGDTFVGIEPRPSQRRLAAVSGGRPPVAAAPRRGWLQSEALTLPYEPPVDVRQMLIELAEARVELTSTLRQTGRIASRDLPRTLADLRQLLSSSDRLANGSVPLALGDLRGALERVARLSVALERETDRTAPQLRQTLRQASLTGQQAQELSQDVRTTLRSNTPLLVDTLREIQRLAASSNRLLTLINGSGLLQEAPPAAAGPGQKPAAELRPQSPAVPSRAP